MFAPDEGDFRGAVVDDLGGALGGARVVSSPGGRSAQTDAGGRFVFKDLPAGAYTLTAEKTGYRDTSVRIDLAKSGGLSCSAPGGSVNIGGVGLEGWESYGAGQMADARAEFWEAVIGDPGCVDAYNGLGWTYAGMDSLDRARAGFEAAVAEDSTFADALAGLALVASALEEHALVVTSATAVLEEEGDGYVFRRDPSVDARDLRLVLAMSYLAQEDYDAVQTQVDLLDPDNGLDPGTPASWWVGGIQYATYEEALLAELELLGQSLR